ncbi:MAG: IscA/HesB family protein [Desulfarculales bacterium]|jgi:Fe-S cluster assembly iron-binding protein IscA|nr:IscA/HesB family protein [Desulfarculales bacterium]
MINVTSEAGQAIKDYLASQKISGKTLRIYLGGGCGGASLRLVLDEAKDSDVLYEHQGLNYTIEKSLEAQLGDVDVSLISEDGQEYFNITSTNPPLDTGAGAGAGCAGCSGSCG